MLGRYQAGTIAPWIGHLSDLGDWWDDWKTEAVYNYGSYPSSVTADDVYITKLRPYMLAKFQQEYADALDRINRYAEQAQRIPDPVISESLGRESLRLKTDLENWKTLERDIMQGGNGVFAVSDAQIRLDVGDFHAVRDSIVNFYTRNAPIFQAVPKINIDAEAAADKVRAAMTPEIIQALEEKAGGWFRSDDYFALVKNQYFMVELLKQYNKQLSTDTLNAITVQINQNQKLIDESKTIIASVGGSATAAVNTVVDAVKNAGEKAKNIAKWGLVTLVVAGGLGAVGTVSLIVYAWKRIFATGKSRRR